MNEKSGRYFQIANQLVDDRHASFKELVSLLNSIQELESYKSSSIQRSPSGSQSIKLDNFAHWLLAQSRIKPAREVIAQLKSFLKADSVPMTQVLAVWGLHPKLPIDLIDGISLSPLSMLPSSDIKDQLTGIKDTGHTGGTSFSLPRPTAVLKWEFVFKPLFSPSGSNSSLNTKIEEMKEIAECLCLVYKTPVFEIVDWYQCEVTTPIIGGVQGWGGQVSSIEPIFRSEITSEAYDKKLFKELVNKFFSVSSKDRQRLHVPLKHLNKALLNIESVETAIDLGIALESLLINPDEGEGNISYKVRQRGTLLLGGSPHEKLSNFNLLKVLYKIRNDAVHTGEVKTTYKMNGIQVSVRELLKDGGILIVGLIREIFNRGNFISDWDGKLLSW